MVLDQHLLVILLCVHPPAALVYWLLCRLKRPATAGAEPASALQRTKDWSAPTQAADKAISRPESAGNAFRLRCGSCVLYQEQRKTEASV